VSKRLQNYPSRIEFNVAEIAGLFLILIVIYISECIVWTKPGDWILYGRRKKHWRVVRSPQFMIGDTGGFTIIGAVPPLPVYVLISASENVLNAGKASPAKRKEPSFDISSLEERVRNFEEKSRIVQIVGNLLFLMIFLVLPAVLWTETIAFYWLPLAIGFLCLWVLGIGSFFVAHRHLFQDKKAQRWKRTLLIGISPLSTIRAANQLSKDLVRDFHPIAACYYLCSRSDFEHHARMTYYDVTRAPLTNMVGVPLNVHPFFRSENNHRLAKFLKSIGYLARIIHEV
jgi:hypothetical protein